MSRLTDAAIRKAKPKARQYKLTDGKGLYVIVRPDGAKWWRFDYTIAGQPRRTMGLGTYPVLELSDARDRRDEARKLVAAGINPVRQRRSDRATASDSSFKTIAEQWMEATRNEWSDRTYKIRKNRLEKHVFPEIGSQDIRSIEPTEMLRMIRKIEATGVAELPWRMRADCSAIFQFAIAAGWKARDPTADIRKALKKQPPATHRAFIRPDDMGTFLAALHEGEPNPVTRDAMLLTILTACRTVEVRFAARSEFEGLDGARPQWRIPAERMKMNREHIVPLSRQAVEIVKRRIAAAPGELLFGRRTESGVISSNTMIYALYRLGYHSRATVHGFRRTLSTLANSATIDVEGQEVRMWEPDWIEWTLAHTPGGVRKIYNAAEYLPQRRRLLQWWADWIDAQRTTALLIG